MGKASKSKPSSPRTPESPIIEEALKALQSHGAVQESLVERMAVVKKVVKLRMEALEAKNTTLFTNFEGLFASLCGRLADVE